MPIKFNPGNAGTTMYHSLKNIITALLLLMIIIAACSELRDDNIVTSVDPPKYSTEIVPLFTSQCTSCHSGTTPDGDYDLSTIIGVFGTGTDDIVNAIPGDPTSKLLLILQNPGEISAHDIAQSDVTKLTDWVVDNDMDLINPSAHPEGWNNPGDPVNFLGIWIRENNWDFDACTNCHGTDYNGGMFVTAAALIRPALRRRML
jgi:hypothetical protein